MKVMDGSNFFNIYNLLAEIEFIILKKALVVDSQVVISPIPFYRF